MCEPGFSGRPFPGCPSSWTPGSIDDALPARVDREIDANPRRVESAFVIGIGDAQLRPVIRCEAGQSGPADVLFDGGGRTAFSLLSKRLTGTDPTPEWC